MKPRFLALFATIAGTLGLLTFAPESSDSPNASLAVSQKTKANQPGKKKKKKKQKKQPVRVQAQYKNADFVKLMLDSARQSGARVLSRGDSCDDFASIAQDSEGNLFAAYAAYYDGHDQIRLHKRLPNGQWSTHSPVPLVQARADIWMPQLAVDAKDRVWVIWAEQTGQSKGVTGNWDLYARPRIGERWGKLVRLTTDPKPDINPHVTVDAHRNIHVVWQAHPKNSGDVQYCRFDGKTWSKPLAVTSDAESDWYPRVAVAKDGTAWIAFDSYRNGDYDVFLTSVKKNGKLGKVISIAASSYYEAHPSVAVTPDGKVWVAWEQGGHNWGKDQGYWLRRENRDQGSTLGSRRTVKVACFDGTGVLAAPDVAQAIPLAERGRPTAMAGLAVGNDGRLWLRFRRVTRGVRRGRRRFSKGWIENVTHLTKEGWAKSVDMPASQGRISVFSRALPAADGSLWVAYSGDARHRSNYHRPIQDHAMVFHVKAPEPKPGAPRLEAYKNPDPPAGIPKWNTRREEGYLKAIRSYRAEIDGKPHRIIRGDLHRHTELSWDVGPGNDGSFLDFYRYMIDVAAMDFGGLTDHQGGGHYAYWWWLIEKSCDLYYLAPKFVPLYGYERSCRFPNGHRNIFHAYRGVPVFKFQLRLDQRSAFPGVGTGALVDNDTKLLYEYLHRTGGLCLSHTSGTSSMGTDWRDNDPVIEPVVEIYQGCRNSYEALGAPRVHSEKEPPGRAPGGFQKAGLLWNAYKKGYRLGITASSDHGSTHISYSLVYVPKNDRQEILDAIRKRHTYGATDTIIVEVRANGRFMGDEYSTKDKPSLKIKVNGTGKIQKIDLVRNNAYLYSMKTAATKVEFTYTDMKPAKGLNLYYVRVLQENGEVAWGSPVWVKWE